MDCWKRDREREREKGRGCGKQKDSDSRREQKRRKTVAVVMRLAQQSSVQVKRIPCRDISVKSECILGD
jgi:hypothetical protein